jgi:hypothetical protein
MPENDQFSTGIPIDSSKSKESFGIPVKNWPFSGILSSYIFAKNSDLGTHMPLDFSLKSTKWKFSDKQQFFKIYKLQVKSDKNAK